MGWTGHVARVGRDEVRTGFWSENLRERGRLEDVGLLACIYKKGSPRYCSELGGGVRRFD